MNTNRLLRRVAGLETRAAHPGVVRGVEALLALAERHPRIAEFLDCCVRYDTMHGVMTGNHAEDDPDDLLRALGFGVVWIPPRKRHSEGDHTDDA